MNTYNQELVLELPYDVTLSIKREDLIHPFISGNKFRKLKYNVRQARLEGYHTLLTFGGAYSNHIAATAAAGAEYGFRTIGVIRGGELADKADANPTLAFAREQGMQLHFISREAYRLKHTNEFAAALQKEWGSFYRVPEGGTNALAVKGCEEILEPVDGAFTHVACAVGTGGTISGLINSSLPNQRILGFPALKNAGLSADIRKFVLKDNWDLVEDYHFGGYGKINEELISFINQFYQDTGVPLDPVYTGKMVFGVIAMIQKGYFPQKSRILLIHTGGLQGIAGMNRQLERRKMPLLKIPDHA